MSRHGEVRPTVAGQVLFREGDPAYDVMVVLEGSMSVLVGVGEEERELVSQGPGDLMVELNLFHWAGHRRDRDRARGGVGSRPSPG